MTTVQKISLPNALLADKWTEQIMVVKNSNLFGTERWQNIKTADLELYITAIIKHTEFMPRGLAETNFEYKQIIPYVIFTHDNKYFLMQRKGTASESRLASNYSLGIGGHLRQDDIKSDSVFEWAQREFNEEITYADASSYTFLGILNDDSNEVGSVHLGVIILLKGASDKIAVRSELKSGQLLTLEECKTYYPQMESWTQKVFDMLSQ